MQRLADRIKHYVPTSIRKKSNIAREQPPRLRKNRNAEINCESAKGKILLQIQNAPKHIQTIIFGSLGKQDRPFIQVVWNLSTQRLKTQSCVDKKSLYFL